MKVPLLALIVPTILVALLIVLLWQFPTNEGIEAIRILIELPTYLVLFILMGPRQVVQDLDRTTFYIYDFLIYYGIAFLILSVIRRYKNRKNQHGGLTSRST